MAKRKKPTTEPPPPPPVDPMVATFENAILENPDEDAAYLVYADYLMAQNDPRGELIVMQHDADEAEGPRKRQLTKAANAILEQHAAYFYGPLATIKRGTYKAVWRYGYIRKLVIEWSDGGAHTYEDKALETLATILQHPSTRFLLELHVGCIYDDYYDIDIQSVIDTLAGLQKPAVVRVLDLSVTPGTHFGSDFCEVAPLVKALPRLERIRLRERRWDEPRPDDLVHEMMIERKQKKKPRAATSEDVSVQ
jgi:uncharacterized protein (TIGR02996 family)